MEIDNKLHCEDCDHCRMNLAPTCAKDGHTVNLLTPACKDFETGDRPYPCGTCHWFAANYCKAYDEVTYTDSLVYGCDQYEPKIEL